MNPAPSHLLCHGCTRCACSCLQEQDCPSHPSPDTSANAFRASTKIFLLFPLVNTALFHIFLVQQIPKAVTAGPAHDPAADLDSSILSCAL